jgi:MoxR-like ATPase
MTANTSQTGQPAKPAPPVSPDRRDGLVYVMRGDLKLAVRVADATGRPLLLRGDPGTGKSSLAAYLARERKARYYEMVVSSRTQAQDLLWSFDVVRRLADAQAKAVRPDYAYVEPGLLWWALAPESAARRGLPGGRLPRRFVRPVEPFAELNATRSDQLSSVLLIDEIDKAEPDFPNSILVALGSNEFTVPETGITIRPEHPDRARHLVVITTNGERELPQAFLRRCIVASLESPARDSAAIQEIIRMHMISYHERWTDADAGLAKALADQLAIVADKAKEDDIRLPSVAEALDAFRACRALNVEVPGPEWDKLTGLILLKPQQTAQ